MYRTGDLARWLDDGNIEFLGRKDLQVKIRGFRVELGEIEARLHEHGGVDRAAVAVVEDPLAGNRLAAYVALAEGSGCTTAELRDYLKQKLPVYMVPATWITLPSLPLGPTGKIDRKALPAPQGRGAGQPPDYVAPRNEAEKHLEQWWREILGIEQIGVHDNFFELGGHSLLATQLLSRIRTGLQMDVPLRSLFEFPTIARFSAYVQALRSDWLKVPATLLTAKYEEGEV